MQQTIFINDAFNSSLSEKALKSDNRLSDASPWNEKLVETNLLTVNLRGLKLPIPLWHV